MQGENEHFDYIVTPFPEKIARILHLPYPVAWLVLSGILFGLHAGGCLYSGRPFEPIILSVVFALLPSCIASGIIWLSKVLEKFTPSLFMFINQPKEEILKWYESELRAIFKLNWMILMGLALSAICVTCIFSSEFGEGFENLQKITLGIMAAIIGFMGGGMFYAMIRIAIMVYKIGKLEAIKVSIYQHPLASVKAVGSLLSKVAFVIIGIYLFGISSIFIETTLQGKIILWVVVFFGVVVILFFIFPQIKIHKIMSRVKHMRLRAFSRHLEEAFESVTKEPSTENIQQVRELFEIQRSLNDMGEWPFDTKLLLLVLTGVAIPIIVILLQVIYSIISK